MREWQLEGATDVTIVPIVGRGSELGVVINKAPAAGDVIYFGFVRVGSHDVNGTQQRDLAVAFWSGPRAVLTFKETLESTSHVVRVHMWAAKTSASQLHFLNPSISTFDRTQPWVIWRFQDHADLRYYGESMSFSTELGYHPTSASFQNEDTVVYVETDVFFGKGWVRGMPSYLQRTTEERSC